MEGPLQSDQGGRKVRSRIVLFVAALVTLPLFAAPKNVPAKSVETAHRKTPYVGAIAADAQTGRIIFSDKPDAEAYPASVTKLMTALLVMEDVENGKYDYSTSVTATRDVVRCEASWIGIRAGQSMTVDDLMLAMLVHSANDAAIVLGVNSAGSLEAFVDRMNQRAKELGMENTAYFNPNGLPKPKYAKEFNRSTAADQLKLALEIVKHETIFKWTSVKLGEARDGNGTLFKMVNHNNVMVKDKWKVINPDGTEAIDGLKTGFINAGGSSVVLTGKRGGKRAIVVVLGSSSVTERDTNARRLMEDALSSISW